MEPPDPSFADEFHVPQEDAVLVYQSLDQPGKVASSTRGQLNGETYCFPAPEKFRPRETGSAVSSGTTIFW